jgi:uncharacterized Fe-S cluster protein YjdI
MSNKITKTELDEIKNHEVAGKEYTNGEISVFWKRDLCIHSANCLVGSPLVFNLRKRPWVDIDGATSEEIIKTVDSCPSRALTYLIHQKEKAAAAKETAQPKDNTARIEILRDGPALVKGDFIILDPDKNRMTPTTAVAALCRCGASKKKPFCDGSHKKVGFTD